MTSILLVDMILLYNINLKITAAQNDILLLILSVIFMIYSYWYVRSMSDNLFLFQFFVRYLKIQSDEKNYKIFPFLSKSIKTAVFIFLKLSNDFSQHKCLIAFRWTYIRKAYVIFICILPYTIFSCLFHYLFAKCLQINNENYNNRILSL